MTWVRIDLMGFLFGDILAVSVADIAIIYGGGVVILVALVVHVAAAAGGDGEPGAGGSRGAAARSWRGVVLMLLLASVIAIAMKLVGVLLITSLLIIPAATARRLSATPEQMAVIAAVLGALAVVGGLFGSLQLRYAVGPVDRGRGAGAVPHFNCLPVQLWRQTRARRLIRPIPMSDHQHDGRDDLTRNQDLVLKRSTMPKRRSRL